MRHNPINFLLLLFSSRIKKTCHFLSDSPYNSKTKLRKLKDSVVIVFVELEMPEFANVVN